MAKVKWLLGIVVIVVLLIGSSAPFVVSTGPTLAQDIAHEKDTTGEMSARPAKMVLESPIEISRAEPLQEPAERLAGWQNIMTDGFEGAFPGVWSLYLTPGATDACWGKDNYRSHSGSYSAFCAKSGTAGINPPNHYPNNMDAWMIYGPFSLADATDAKVDFWLWLESEFNYDFVYCMASTDAIYFYGLGWCGDSAGWASTSFDLTDVYALGNLCGESQVWIAFIFTSDDIITNKGAFVDDIVLRKYVAPSEAGWTFMAYLDGDNNLEDSEIGSFNRMELAANNANVNVVVQFDRIPGYDSSNGDWTTTRRYKVKYDADMVNFASYTEGVDYWDLGELNMARPNNLIDFIQWAKSNYPADHYCLVLANHGSGWQPRGGGQLVPRGILWDDTDGGDYMTTAELGNALNSATFGGAQKLDVLFLDACLMQMVEVGYEVRLYSQYLVTTEYLGWGSGPYHDYISSITATTTAPQLATAIVNKYHDYLMGWNYAHTMSAVDLTQFGLASVVDDFAQELTTRLSTYKTQIDNSRNDCQRFDDYYPYIDLYHFAFLINQNIADPTIQNAAQAVMAAVNNAVIAEAHGSGGGDEYYPLDNAHGISIYFPASEGDSGYSNYNSGNLAFVADKGWDEFLAAFFGGAPTVTSVSIEPSSQTVPAGGTCSVDVLVDSADTPITACNIAITFDGDDLEATGVTGADLLGAPGVDALYLPLIDVGEVSYGGARLPASGAMAVNGNFVTIDFAVDPAAFGSYDLVVAATLHNAAGNPIAVITNNGQVNIGTSGRKGDFDTDGDIDFFDFYQFCNAYSSELGDPNYNAIGDFDDDGDVDFLDFYSFCGVYGT